MRFSALRSNLVDALTPAARAVAKRSSLPVLGNVLLSTDDGEVVISGTDLEHGVTTRCPGKIDEDGAVTVPAADLLRIVKSAPKDALVTISADTAELAEAAATTAQHGNARIPVSINAGGATYTLSGISREEYPSIPEPGKPTFQIVAHDLARILAETIPAAATDESKRIILTGVLLTVNNGRNDDPGTSITAVAADNYRIAASTGETITPAEVSIVIPATIAASLVALLRGPEVVSVSVTNPAQAIVTFGDKHGREVVFVTRLIDGSFPNYQQVMPVNFGTTAIVNRVALVEAMARADKMSPNHVAKMSFGPEGIRVTAKGYDGPAFDAMIPATVTGEPASVGTSANQWTALAPLTDELVRIRLSAVADFSLSPFTVDVPGLPARSDFTYVVMPVRTTS